jgi:hypothetical protein
MFSPRKLEEKHGLNDYYAAQRMQDRIKRVQVFDTTSDCQEDPYICLEH